MGLGFAIFLNSLIYSFLIDLTEYPTVKSSILLTNDFFFFNMTGTLQSRIILYSDPCWTNSVSM